MRLVSRDGKTPGGIGEAVRLSSHMLRRSGATLLETTLLASPEASRDGVYRTVQAFLRHANLGTTMKYLESNPGRQERALERYALALPWGKRGASPRRPPREEPSRGPKLADERWPGTVPSLWGRPRIGSKGAPSPL